MHCKQRYRSAVPRTFGSNSVANGVFNHPAQLDIVDAAVVLCLRHDLVSLITRGTPAVQAFNRIAGPSCELASTAGPGRRLRSSERYGAPCRRPLFRPAALDT